MIYIGKRNIILFFKRIINIRNIFSTFNFFRLYDNPLNAIFDEIFSLGKYPKTIFIKTPIGKKKITLYSPNDFSTLNLIFCRKDYFYKKDYQVILDIGSNIGISSFYWLTRNKKTKVYCYEPSTKNINKLKKNLLPFKKRVFLQKKAVSNRDFTTTLNIEKTGVYSSINKLKNIKFTNKEKCRVVDINKCINKIIKINGKLDMIKIDSEGEELKTLYNIKKNYMNSIKCINMDLDKKLANKKILHKFKISKVGSATRLIK
jgi:FkbM family methyltransferase